MPLPQILQPLHSFFMVVSFVLGCLVGSFCNVCICRWPAEESVVSPRSRCPKCFSAIAWYDNIPLLSWLFLGAKCRHCGQPISWQYPLVEGVTGVLFLLVYWRFGFSIATPVYMALSAGLVIATFQDLTDWTIPNQVTIPGILAGLGVALLGMIARESNLRVTDPVVAFDGVVLACFIICLLDGVVVLLLHKPGMGFGDVKLLAMLGAFFGWQGVLGVVFLASFAGSAVGMILLGVLRLRGGSSDAEPPAADKHKPLPIDPVANLALGASTIYLAARVLVHVEMDPELLGAARQPVLLAGLALVLIAGTVAGISLHIHRKQRASVAASAADTNENEEEITLRGHYLPFGPYLALGGLLFMLFGPELITLYLAMLEGPPVLPPSLP